jgi:hypothetical protein
MGSGRGFTKKERRIPIDRLFESPLCPKQPETCCKQKITCCKQPETCRKQAKNMAQALEFNKTAIKTAF